MYIYIYRHVYISSISYIKSQMICDASPFAGEISAASPQTPPWRSADCWMTSRLMSIDVHWTQAFGVPWLIQGHGFCWVTRMLSDHGQVPGVLRASGQFFRAWPEDHRLRGEVLHDGNQAGPPRRPGRKVCPKSWVCSEQVAICDESNEFVS